MARTVPASAWMAEQVLAMHQILHFAEDDYAYDRKSGLYERVDRQWLAHQVQAFAVELLGGDRMDASYIEAISRSVRQRSFLSGSSPPPSG